MADDLMFDPDIHNFIQKIGYGSFIRRRIAHSLPALLTTAVSAHVPFGGFSSALVHAYGNLVQTHGHLNKNLKITATNPPTCPTVAQARPLRSGSGEENPLYWKH
jgi:hypothetical protein